MYTAKMVQSVADEYEDLKSSDDDNEVVIYTLKGEQVGTKRKVPSTRMTSKSVRTKMGQ